MRTFLICDDEIHAEVVDNFIAARLHDVDGSKCSAWSGVFTDGTRYGVLWDSPASDLFGLPEDFPELVLATETEVDEWELAEPAPAEDDEAQQAVSLLRADSYQQAADLAVMIDSRVWRDFEGSKTRYAVELRLPEHADIAAEAPARVIEGTVLVRDTGRFVSGNWEVFQI